ncbi:hypothetical protein WA026_006093 [Henosepilachna vigintioctopunctata]|uniref:Uncharacterized protein n=1 Tax=Henosepilachna vigintioctopunctata TaxID=420089 RepID=A0AAW1TJI8_9CUCU
MKVISNTVEWRCSGNLMYLNLYKTECAVFQTEQSKCKIPKRIQTENKVFEPTKTVKFLGLCILLLLYTSCMVHVETLNKKLNSVIYTFNVIKLRVKEDIMENLYFANFQSLLSY